MIDKIESAIRSMGQRKILFIIGDHLSGKTDLIRKFLNGKYEKEDITRHYVDVGIYIKSRIDKEHLDTYRIYPEEFKEDAKFLFKDLTREKYDNTNLVVFDHMEFLLSEKYTGWIKILDRKTSGENTAIVIVPSEYKESLPLKAYKYIEI